MSTRWNAIEASDGTTMVASRRRPSQWHVVNHDTRQSSARNAAMTLAETRDLAPGQKWRMAWTNGDRTSLVDVPYAAAWVAMAWIQILRLFGRDVEMLDWRAKRVTTISWSMAHAIRGTRPPMRAKRCCFHTRGSIGNAERP